MNTMNNDGKYIICDTHAGLSNRIICYLSASRIARQLGRSLKIYWPINNKCGAAFPNLFNMNVEVVNKIEAGIIFNCNDLINLSIKENLIINTWRFALTIEEWKSGVKEIDFIYDQNRIDLKIREAFQKEISYLKFNEQIINTVSDFANKFFSDEIFGLHIRRTDHLIAKRCSPISEFYNVLTSELKIKNNAYFFLATDCPITEKIIKEHFPQRCITYNKSFHARSNTDSIEEALVELLLLSKTKKIIGSFASTFTELAWWLSDFKPIIIVKDIKEVNKFQFDGYELL